ncbi:MAG TPA: alkaline phosphatase family protein [Solirubrobacteraceae bacterium]|nr:alkaline phosphatase family protein [Solirubrobacteraceae bacterium]
MSRKGGFLEALGRLAIAAAAAAAATTLALSCASPAVATPAEGIHNIQHVVMIMQENRSFDSYFGTYPGANGIPAGICVPDPLNGGCVAPFHDALDKNAGGPHGRAAALKDINGGSMDGFIERAEAAKNCSGTDPNCSQCVGADAQACTEVMGYHDAREIPNYWAYAQNYVLQDRMYEAELSASEHEHNALVSEWNAKCPKEDVNPMDCVNYPEGVFGGRPRAWTDITYLLAKANVSWRYYIFSGTEPDCESDEATSCAPVQQGPKTPGIWNPLAEFTDVAQDGQLDNIQGLNQFFGAVHEQSACGLPNVSWVDPKFSVSEHPNASIAAGQAYVTTLVNAIMRSPCWQSTAIFLSWDDWGGLYDHLAPPSVDENGYGLRVPGLVISPYAKTGYVDHQQLSHDAYLKFIEDDFLSGARLDPATDGRPDKRPDVRDALPGLGDLANEFDFQQVPRAPVLLTPRPPPGPASEPPGGRTDPPIVVGGEPASITQTTARLNATVDAGGTELGDCHFEYGTSVFYDASVPCVPTPQAGQGAMAVSASLEALLPDTTYHFRIVATNEHGAGTGSDQSLRTLPNPPTLSAVSPVAGLEGGGTAVTLEGTNLGAVTKVSFGTSDASSFTINSDSSITAVSPSGAGNVDVTVANAGGTSASGSFDRFAYVPKGPRPQVSGIAPEAGPSGGGTSVTVGGAGFVGVTAVHFGATAASGYTTESSTSLTATSPALAAGTVNITVTTPNGTSATSLSNRFRAGPPTITGVSPTVGSTTGGTSVAVTGTGFALGSSATTLKFGSTSAASVQCSTTAACTAVAPAHKAGAVDVKATVGSQTSVKTAADRFAYE